MHLASRLSHFAFSYTGESYTMHGDQ